MLWWTPTRSRARGDRLLNIGKLRRGGENYYLNSVARGVEDYYLGSGEAPGYWLASGARELSLEGRVGDDQLRSVLRGIDPDSGEVLARGHKKDRVPGFDLTFLAPKSVALLHELGTKEASNEAMNAHDVAVAAALDYIERHASGARRGKGGRRSIGSKGFIAAAFRHRTSRAGDPLLHTHVLVANLIQGEDGKWGALDAKHLYRHAKTAGYLYQAQLRTELTRRLGVAWTPVRKGAADIDGIPRTAIRAFSKRRAEVESVLAERGGATRRQREVAALTTRQAKDYSVSPQKLLPEWQDKAREVGLSEEVLEATLDRVRSAPEETHDPMAIAARLAAPQGLTAQSSSFSRREVLQGFCSELPNGAPISDIETMADQFLVSGAVIALSERSAGPTAHESDRVLEGRIASSTGERRYTTAEMLAVERNVIERAVERRLDGAGVAAPAAVATALERRGGLFPDQKAMVTSLTNSGLGVEVVVGKAGAGKTFALDAAREAWELSGYRVIGCSLSARAAQELQVGSGIQSYTIASLLQDLDNPNGALQRDTVIVVDEAGMVGTRSVDRLLEHAQRAGAKVVLVGDDRQLPEIEAGGAFRGIKNRLPAIELSEVRRQPFGWERDALDLLREGRAEQAIAEYTQRGRVHVASSADETRARLIADWWATRDDPVPGVMIAARRSDVADLNARARHLLLADGRIGSDELEVSGQRFSVGDRVMTLKNARRLGVFNGTRAIVESVDQDNVSVTVRLDDDRQVSLPKAYVEAGYLTHSYAITGHKAQGMTTEKAFVLGDETLYREWGYVAMSRGKQSNSLYVVTGVDPEREELGGEIASVSDPTSELIRALGRSRAKDLAVDVYEEDEIRNLSLPQLRRQWEESGSVLSDVPRDVTDELARVSGELNQVEKSLSREQGLAKAARDRLDNMGVIQRRRDRPDVARLKQQITAGRKVETKLLSECQRLSTRRQELEGQDEMRQGWLVENAPLVRKRFALERELWWREHQTALAAEVAAPTYLSRAVGERPSAPSERAAWRQAIRAVESYRERWDVQDEQSALGRGATEGAQKRERDELKQRITRDTDPSRSQEREETIERTREF